MKIYLTDNINYFGQEATEFTSYSDMLSWYTKHKDSDGTFYMTDDRILECIRPLSVFEKKNSILINTNDTSYPLRYCPYIELNDGHDLLRMYREGNLHTHIFN